MTWYVTGTISVTNGAPTVYGTGTLWVDTGTLNAGDIMLVASTLYQIQSIQSNTQLTLSSNFLGTTASGLSYSIIPIGLLPSALAQQVKTTLASASTALASAVLNSAGQPMTTTQQLNARQNIAALGAGDVGQGYVTLSVAGNTNVSLTSAQGQASIINLTGVLTGNIDVITSMTPRLYIVENATTGAFTVTFIGTSGSGVVVPQGGTSLLMCDGINIAAASSTFSWTGLTSVPTAITSYAETMDQAVATTNSPAFVSVATNGVTIGAIPAARIKGYYGLLDTIGYVGNIATITVGTTPSGIAYCPTNNSIYVANEGAGTVSVINSATNVVSTTVTVGTDPNDVAYCPTNNSIYVTNYGSGTVSVINSATNVVSTTVTVGTNPNDVAYCPSVDRTYVTNQGSNNVSVLT